MAHFELVERIEVDALERRIAAQAARAIIECECLIMASGDVNWRDTRELDDETREIVGEAIRYIELRADTLPYRMVRSAALPHLVKFVEKD